MTAGKNITLKNSNSFLKALCLPSSTNAQATEAQKKLYPFLMSWQNPFCLGQKHLGINHSDSGVWWPPAPLTSGPGQHFPAGASLSPSSPGGHTRTEGVSPVCWAPRGVGDGGGVPDTLCSVGQEQWKPLGRALAWLCPSSAADLAEEFTLAPVFLLGFPFLAECSEIHLFQGCLGWTLVTFQTSIKTEPRPFFPRKLPFCSVAGMMMSEQSI